MLSIAAMRRTFLIVWAGIAAVVVLSASPADARSTGCGTKASLPSSLTDRYDALKAPARRGDALPKGSDCKLGDLTTFRRGVRLLSKNSDGTRTYLVGAYKRKRGSSFTGVSACVATVTKETERVRRRGKTVKLTYFSDISMCTSMPEKADRYPAGDWMSDGKRVMAAIPNGVASVRVRQAGQDSDRIVRVRRNAVVLDGSAPSTWTWLAADGSEISKPFVCEDEE